MSWTAVWTKEPDGAGDVQSRSLSQWGQAYLNVGTTGDNDVNLGDVSEPIVFTAAETMVAVNADQAGDAAGAFAMDVRRVITADTLAGSVTVASLSAGTPGVYNAPPGRYIMECTAAADTDGEVVVQGRGLGA